jgi:NADH:ubiquinone oxidoreductase subunit 2 (subunit N)
VIAAFFYLRVIVLMYMQEPAEELEIERSPVAAFGVAVPAFLTVLFGVLPGLLLGLVRHASVIRF